jgi:succinoglycan biosynthesis protein ExoA
MPVRNEEKHLADSVTRVLGQDYPGGFELVLAVGPSRDRTEQIAHELAAADHRVTVVANPSGKISSAMNAAIKAARHGVITRIDGHAMLPDEYLQVAVRTLLETGAADVGGVMAAEGVTSFQRAVAWAMTSPAGVGAAANHTGGKAGPADTVYLGVYRREAIERAGGYDENMIVAEDWELNYRIRASGGLIWFTPELQVTYRPRANLPELARQHFCYGRWRRVVARRYPETVNPRYLAAPVATAANLAGCAAGIAGLASWAAGAPLADARLRHPRRLRGRNHGGGGRARPRRAALGACASARSARRHAHVLGRRVPVQSAAPREAAIIRAWVLTSTRNSLPSGGRATTCTAAT